MILQVTDDEEQKWERTAVPFIAALAVVAVVIAGIIISQIISPAEGNVSDTEQIRIAVHEFVEARNSGDEERIRDTACAGFDDAWLADRTGNLEVEKVSEADIDGDRATTDVTTKVDDKDEMTMLWTLVKQKDAWLVCN